MRPKSQARIHSTMALPLVLCTGCTVFDDAAPAPDGVTVVAAVSLVQVTDVSPDDGCPEGGQRVSAGLDINDNGVLDAEEVQTDGVVCNGASGMTGMTLGDVSCAVQETLVYDGSAWVCQPSGPGQDTLDGLTCAAGEVAKFDGDAWTCAADERADPGVDTLASLSCEAQQVPAFDGSQWICADDSDTITVNTDTLAALSCQDGELPKSVGGDWQCADDLDTTLDAAGYWRLGGNSATVSEVDYVGTNDDVALQLRVDGARALELQPGEISPSVIAGHHANTAGALAYGCAIGGGGELSAPNRVHDPHNVVAGGADNEAGLNNAEDSEGYATVGGGFSNAAHGFGATVPGGLDNRALGRGSFAAGRRAQAVHDGAFVFADNTDTDFASRAADEFSVRAHGGIRFVVEDCSISLDATGVWSTAGACTSDRRAKKELEKVDAEEILQRLRDIDIGTWAYRGRGERHLGPMAQDFHAAFGLGGSEERIHPLDAAGVSLKAIQALAMRTEVLATQNRALIAQNAALEARLTALESQRDKSVNGEVSP